MLMFKFHILAKCGHKPWIEKYTRKAFYETLMAVIEG
jgi:hypothetical protein